MEFKTYEEARRDADSINEEVWRNECRVSGRPVSAGCTVYQLGYNKFVVGPHGDNWLGEEQLRFFVEKGVSAIASGVTLRIGEDDILAAERLSEERYFTPLETALERITGGQTRPWWTSYSASTLVVGFDDGTDLEFHLSRRLKTFLRDWWAGGKVGPRTFVLKPV